jgi:outer membrane protein TolC
LISLLRLNPWLFHGVIGLDVPIYQGGALRTQIKIATAEQEQAVARYGAVALRAFREVEAALTNQELLTERLRCDQNALADRTEAVRIAKIRYEVGSSDLQSVLQLQTIQIASQADVIKLRNAQLANRINLHLALGGSFDAAPAAVVEGPSGG